MDSADVEVSIRENARLLWYDASKKSLRIRFFSIPRPGIFLAVISSMTFASCGAVAKSVIKNVGAAEVVAVRYCTVGMIMLVPILRDTSSLQISGKKWLIGSIGGSMAGLATVFAYMAYSYIPLMDAQTLFNVQSIFVAVIAFVFLKEKIGFVEILSIVVVFGGVILVCHPTFIFGTVPSENVTHSARLIGSGLALACSFCLASAGVITRYLKDIKSYLFTYFISCGGIVFSLLTIPVLGNMPDPSLWDVGMMVSVGLLGCVSKLFLTLAFQIEDSLPVSLTQSMEIVWAFFLQWIVFDDLPNYIESIGAVLVFLGVGIVTAKNFIKSKLEECCCRSDDSTG